MVEYPRSLFWPNLTGLDLTNLDFSQVSALGYLGGKLNRVDFRGSTFRQGDHADGHEFMRSSLIEANLSGVSLRGGRFAFCDMTKVNLAGAHIEQGWFCEALLVEADMMGLIAPQSDFTDAVLRGVQAQQADLSHMYGMKDVRFANFTEANLEGARFNDVVANNTVFSRANLQGAYLSGVFYA